MKVNAKDIIKKFKNNQKYDENIHPEILVKVMTDPEKGTHSAFCLEVFISEQKFYTWCYANPFFDELYSFCKMYAREIWEAQGREIRDKRMPIGQTDYSFEYWKLIGWSRFGVSKNSRIKLNLNPNDSAEKHYSQLLKQASQGDFTAAEIKQLMEAVNVGLNTHQVFTLQKQIDELNSNLAIVKANTNANNTSTNKRVTETD